MPSKVDMGVVERSTETNRADLSSILMARKKKKKKKKDNEREKRRSEVEDRHHT